MAGDDKIVKIYDISTLGAKGTLKDLDAINQKFIDIKKNKLSLTSLKSQIEDPEELAKIDKELVDLLLTEKKLQVELKQKQVLAKEYQLLQAAEREATKKQKAGIDALDGSYNSINKKYKELLAISKNTTNLFNKTEMQAAQVELKKLKDLLDEFGRGLTKDGTLVGEYTTGILQAFKNSGLDEVINNQIKKAKANVNALDDEFERLRNELKEVQATGKGSLEALEKQLIENRTAAAGFRDQIKRVETELHSMGGVGSSISKSIGTQFKNLKNDIAGFAIGYVGFQGILSAAQGLKNQTVQLDSLDKSLEAVSGSAAEFAKNERYLEELSDRLGVSLLDTSKAFKNFYAASTLAGISANETRRIFSSATEAASVLKLSQDDLNGVLLAFGQIASKGNVQAEELRGQIGERLPGAFSIAAKAMGVTQAELNKMLEKGEVVASEFLPKFATELQKTFSLGGKEATGLAATLARVQTKITEFVKSNQEGFSKLVDGISAVIVGLLSFATFITNIPFPVIVAGLTAVTTALALYKAEQIRAYIATQLATKSGLIYNAYLYAQTAATYIATNAMRIFNLVMRATPWGLIITALTTLAVLIPIFANGMTKAAEGARRMRDQQEALKKSTLELNKAMQAGTANAAAEVSQLNILYNTATNVNRSLVERKAAVDELQRLYPAYFGNIKDEIILNGQAEASYYAVRDAIVAKARAEAGSQELTRRQGDRLQREEALLKAIEKSNEIIRALDRDVKDPLFQGNKADLDLRIEGEKLKKASLERQLFDLRDFARKEDEILIGIVQNEKAKASGLTDLGAVGTGGGAGSAKDKKKKEINRVEILKKQFEDEKAVLNTALQDAKITEMQYYDDLIAAADKYRLKKLQAIQKLSKDELSAKKQFTEELAKEKADALEKEFEIDLKAIKKQRDAEEIRLKNLAAENEADKGITDVQKIQNTIDLDNKLLNLEADYNKAIEVLELKYSLKSAETAEERGQRLITIQQKIHEDLKARQTAFFNELTEEQAQELRDYQAGVTNEAVGILSNEGTTPKRKAKLLDKLEKKGTKGAGTLRLGQIDTELEANKSLLDQKVIQQAEYNARVAELETERLGILKSMNEAELENEKLKNEQKQLLQDAAWQITQKFLDAYFEAQQMEVDANYKAHQDKLEISRKERLERSQSLAETESINREYDEKQKQAERKRNKERQAIARQQLAVEFAVASIKAISTSSTIYEGIVKEAIVFAEYLAALSLLNKQKFAGGGLVQPEKVSNGLVKIAPNTKPLANGDNIVAYLKPGEVVLNQTQQAMLGGARTFSSIGVPGFGSSSQSVQAPVFRSSYSGAAAQIAGTNNIERLEAMVADLAQIIYAESSKQVVLNPNAVRKENTDFYKNIDLATL